MTNFGSLPFEKLIAYQEARELLDPVRESAISEGRLRDQAVRAARGVNGGGGVGAALWRLFRAVPGGRGDVQRRRRFTILAASDGVDAGFVCRRPPSCSFRDVQADAGGCAQRLIPQPTVGN